MEFNEAELYYLLALLKKDFEELREMVDTYLAVGTSDSVLEGIAEYQALNLKIKSTLSLQLEKI